MAPALLHAGRSRSRLAWLTKEYVAPRSPRAIQQVSFSAAGVGFWDQGRAKQNRGEAEGIHHYPPAADADQRNRRQSTKSRRDAGVFI
jgi:hypothetical protein